MHKKEIRELICSMVIGDGHISKRDRDLCFIFEHGIGQEDYASWKADLIDNIFIDKNLPRRCKRRITTQKCQGKSYPGYRVVLYWSDYLRLMRKRTYKYVRSQSRPIKNVEYLLSQMNSDIHLAVWLGDDGGFVGQKSTYALFTYGFTKGQNNLSIEWFKSRYNIVPIKTYFKPRDTYYLKFSASDTNILSEIIRPYFEQIDSMSRKFAFS